MAERSLRRVESNLIIEPASAARRRQRQGLSLCCAAALWCIAFAPSAQAVDLVSVNINGVSGNLPSGGAALSPDGNVVAFFSDAGDLVSDDTNQARDVFVRDRSAMQTERVSVTSAGAQANGPSHAQGGPPGITDDGMMVVFYSDASNLVANDGNGTADVFVRDRTAGTTELVSVNLSGMSGNGPSRFPGISADGQFVVFQSAASDLVSDDTNGKSDIFIRNLQTGVTERVCGVEPNADSFSPAISADGNYVAFVSRATNLVATDTKGQANVYVCERATSGIALVSVNEAGVPGNGDNIAPAISGDGAVIAFKSTADNLVPPDNNGLVDVFVRDRNAGTTERISIGVTGADSNGVSYVPAISRDGRFVIFGSEATNLAYYDTNSAADLFIRDRQNHFTLLADLLATGFQPSAGIPDAAPAISADVGTIAFASFVSRYVPNDFNEQADVFASANPFVCGPGGACPVLTVCNAFGFCEPFGVPSPTPTPTATSPATPTVTQTPTVTVTPTPIACIGIEDCPEGQVCVNGFCAVPTATPTPIPCTVNLDCPPGLVCLNNTCQPPVSPTPTVTPTPLTPCNQDSDCAQSCTTADDCHEGQDCVDEQCSPADRCVDGVCAPTRLCDEGNGTTCIATRETCLDGTCECGGDCNLDGFVYADEIAKMICILAESGTCPVSDCEAGDFDRDGKIMGNEVCQAVTNLGIGCPLGIANTASTESSGQNAQARTLTLTGPAEPVRPGQAISIGVDLSGDEGVADVATAQLDMLYDTSVLSLGAPTIACTVADRLTFTDTSFTFMPRRPDTPPNLQRVRLFVADLNVCKEDGQFPPSAFSDGPMLTCAFQVNPQAPAGQSTVDGQRTNLGDIEGQEIPSSGSSVDITVAPCAEDTDCPDGLLCRSGACVPQCTSDSECAAGTVCRTGACVPECNQDSQCPTGEVCRNSFCVPTCTEDSECSYGLVCRNNACVPPCTETSDCPAGSTCVNGGCTTGECSVPADCADPVREACVNNTCQCGGDCTGDGIIDTSEILRMVSIFGGATPLETCQTGDINGNGTIETNEILAAVFNFGAGCPGTGS